MCQSIPASTCRIAHWNKIWITQNEKCVLIHIAVSTKISPRALSYITAWGFRPVFNISRILRIKPGLNRPGRPNTEPHRTGPDHLRLDINVDADCWMQKGLASSVRSGLEWAFQICQQQIQWRSCQSLGGVSLCQVNRAPNKAFAAVMVIDRCWLRMDCGMVSWPLPK